MNFSKREKYLLICFGVLISLVLFVNFIFMPEMKRIGVLKEQLNTYSQSYNVNLVYKQKVEGMDSDLKIINQELKNLRAEFPPRMNSEELLIMVSDMAKESGVNISNISLDEPAELDTSNSGNSVSNKQTSGGNTSTTSGSGAITDNKLVAAMNLFGLSGVDLAGTDNTKNEKVIIPDGKAYVVGIKINATGSNKQIQDFFSSAVALKNKAMFNDITFTNTGKGVISFTTTLDFYGIMDKNAGFYTLFSDGTWVLAESSGKDNIFNAYSGYTGTVTAGSTTATVNNVPQSNTNKTNNDTSTSTDSYDFSLRVSAFGGSLAPPSVSMAAKNIVSDVNVVGMPLLYGDNNGVENVQIYVEEKDGKFYCKYKTQHGSFPSVNYDQMAEFKPLGDTIKMAIASSLRVDQQDKAGINIVITNKTTKKFTVEVKYEDQANPRVKIDRVGDVYVEYK